MFFSSNKQIQEIVCQYKAAKVLNYNQMANTQVDLIEKLCRIGTKDAFDAVGQIMTLSSSHEYLNFAIPNILAKYLYKGSFKKYAVETLINGMKNGHNEIIRSACIQKLAEARCTSVYRTLLDYRNFLVFDEDNRPSYWSSLLSSVVGAVATLNPYVEESSRIPTQLLRRKQLI
jgi:hypothetical protein